MRRFGIYGIEATEADIGVWLDTGFCEVKAGQSAESEERPDVIFGPLEADNTSLVREVSLLWPKVIVFISQTPAILPQELNEDFRQLCWQQAGVHYLVGTRLEPQLTEPEWAAYGAVDGLDAARALKAVSDQIYRHLLADVFRETREWCGHTFSVVISS